MGIDPGMKTEVTHEDYHIEVQVGRSYHYPPNNPAETHRLRRKELDEVVSSINRHVDDVANAHAVWTTVVICSHCKLDVKDGFIGGEPACCQEAIDDYIALGHTISED